MLIRNGAIDRFCTLPEKTVAPSVATDEAALYAFDEDGLTALYYADSTGFVARPLRDRFVICRNSTGATITKGQAVYVNGFTSSGSSGDKPTIALASATAEATLPCIGLAAVNIAANGFGRVQTDGILTGINTSSSGRNGRAAGFSQHNSGRFYSDTSHAAQPRTANWRCLQKPRHDRINPDRSC
jgi:hypothetical protein